MNEMKYNSEMLNQWLGRSEWQKHARLSGPLAKFHGMSDAIRWDQLKQVLANQPADLIEILAQAMPTRHAVLWGLLCGAGVEGFATCEAAAECVQAALEWVFQTDEPRRLKARAVAEPTDWKMAEGLLARAVAWSSGTILPDSVPAFYPAPAGVTGQMIAGAVRSFAARNTIYEYNELLWHYISLAEGVAQGNCLPEGWERQNLSLGETTMVSLDLPTLEIPGHLGFGF